MDKLDVIVNDLDDRAANLVKLEVHLERWLSLSVNCPNRQSMLNFLQRQGRWGAGNPSEDLAGFRFCVRIQSVYALENSFVSRYGVSLHLMLTGVEDSRCTKILG